MDANPSRRQTLYTVGAGMLVLGLMGVCSQGLWLVGTLSSDGTVAGAPSRANDTLQLLLIASTVSAAVGVVVSIVLLVFGVFTVARLPAVLVVPKVLYLATVAELAQTTIIVWGKYTVETAAYVTSDVTLPTRELLLVLFHLALPVAWAVAKIAFFVWAARRLASANFAPVLRTKLFLEPRS